MIFLQTFLTIGLGTLSPNKKGKAYAFDPVPELVPTLVEISVDWRMLISLLVGSIPKANLASLLAGKVSGLWVQVALALVLMVAGVRVLM